MLNPKITEKLEGFWQFWGHFPGDQCELEQRHQQHRKEAPGNRLLAAAPAAVWRLQRCDVAAGCRQLQCHRQCHHSAVGTMAGGSGAEPDANAKFGREPGEHQWFDGGSQMLGGGFRHISNMFLLGEAFQPLQLARAQHRMLIHSPQKKWEDDISPKCHDDPASHLVYWRMAQAQHLEGWQRAAHILKTLRHGPQADAITFNTALDGYTAATCWGDAVNLAEEMSRHQVNGDDLMDLLITFC